MQGFAAFFEKIDAFVWGAPLIILLLGTGLFLTIRLRLIQFKTLIPSLKLALVERKEKGKAEGDISHFQALMTALSATVGTGNIAGVATAISIGGPGALFWIWITGLVGMATKYAEAILAVKFRTRDRFGTMSGGPMYYITNGMRQRWLGILFAIFASIAAFGIGNMVQSNSIADAVEATFKIPPVYTGFIIAFFTGITIIGGIKSIARVTSVIVPFMIILYLLSGVLLLFLNIKLIPEAIKTIFKYAFTSHSAVGGFAGSTVMLTIRYGVARGLFSNESGLGSSPIAAAAAVTRNPFRQAIVSMSQTFIDTLVVCSITGISIVLTGMWKEGLTGAELTSQAFTAVFGTAGSYIVATSLLLFAFSTILGWCYYGEKSVEFLAGESAVKPYRYLWTGFVFVGAVVKLEVVWTLADIMNGLMALPNLIALLFLSRLVVGETEAGIREFFNPEAQKST